MLVVLSRQIQDEDLDGPNHRDECRGIVRQVLFVVIVGKRAERIDKAGSTMCESAQGEIRYKK